MGKYTYWGIGVDPGDVFIYMGDAYECEQCVNRGRCHGSLRPGFTYRIVSDTGGDRVYCALRGCEIVPYEVALEPITLLVPAGRFKERALMELGQGSFCKTGCGRIDKCPIVFNRLVSNNRIRVLKKLGGFDCPEKKLILVEAEVLE